MDENFVEIIFPEISAVIKSSIEFFTKINRTKNNNEFRYKNSSSPLLNYEIIGDTISKKDFKEIEAIFNLAQGSFSSFLFKDPMNNVFEKQTIGIYSESSSEFEISRSYDIQNFNIKFPIYNIKKSSVKVYADFQEIKENDYEISGNVLRFNTSLALNSAISIAFEYFIKVRFLEDQLNYTTTNKNNFGFQSIKLIQVL